MLETEPDGRAGRLGRVAFAPTDPGENTIVRGSAPISQGRETCRDFRVLGMCPAPVAGSSDITGLYTARYGVPTVAKKVYIQVNLFVDG